MDFRNLLKKYMGLVVDHEGTDYLDSLGVGGTYRDEITPEEMAELEAISNELDEDV